MDIRSKKGKEHKLTINRRVRTIGHLLNQHKFNMNMINYNTTQETVTTRIRNIPNVKRQPSKVNIVGNCLLVGFGQR